MSENKAAKPAKTNEAWVAELMDGNNPKNEMEWAAFHEIRRLRSENQALVELRPTLERLDIAFDHINSLSRRVDRLLYVVDKLHRGEKVEIGETE